MRVGIEWQWNNPWKAVLLLITPHPDAIGLHDPQASGERLPRELTHEPLTDLEHDGLVLPWETKHQQA